MHHDTEEEADVPEWVFSAASCLARNATAALLMPSANLMPADDMQNHQGLQYSSMCPKLAHINKLSSSVQFCSDVEAMAKQAKEDIPTSVSEDI